MGWCEDAEELRENLVLLDTQIRGLQSGPSSRRYTTFYGYVAAEGGRYQPRALPARYERMEAKECFFNATSLALDSDRLHYIEGYAVSAVIPLPILHAWCVDDAGRVIDPTWEEPEKCVYFGVEFSTLFMSKTITSRGFYGVIDNMEDGFPLLRGEAA